MSEHILFGRFEVDSELNADDVFRYVIARDKQNGNQRLVVAQLQAPWRENSTVVADLNEYFGRLQRVKASVVMQVLVVTQNRSDGFGVAFGEPSGISLDEISDLDDLMSPTDFVDNLCEAVHKANVKGVFHCHLRKQDIWVSGNSVGITGFGYSVVAKHGWKGDSIDMPPELVSGGGIDSRSDVYSIAQLLLDQYPERRETLQCALNRSPDQRPKKARELSSHLLNEWNDSGRTDANNDAQVNTQHSTNSEMQPEQSKVVPKRREGIVPIPPEPPEDRPETAGQVKTEDGDMPAKGEDRLRELVRNMVYDDYCDQKTERELVREAVDKLGMDQTDALLIISLELESMCAVNERKLLEALEDNLRQKSSSRGGKLKAKDKDDVLGIVCNPKRAVGYAKGLNRQVAEQRFIEYCRAHGIKVKSGPFGWKVP